MSDMVKLARAGLEKLNDVPGGGHVKTGEIRKLSARLYRGMADKSKDGVFAACRCLLEERDWPMGVIAFDFAYRVRAQYDEDTFCVFENWLITYVRGWGDCDDFCTHAFGELILQDTRRAQRVIPWTKRGEFWMRRAAAVVLIPAIHRGKHQEVDPTRISDLLMTDGEDLVRKGYGWMLKVLSVKEPQLVYEYLRKNKEVMPRVAFRYALEKLDGERKRELMRL